MRSLFPIVFAAIALNPAFAEANCDNIYQIAIQMAKVSSQYDLKQKTREYYLSDQFRKTSTMAAFRWVYP